MSRDGSCGGCVSVIAGHHRWSAKLDTSLVAVVERYVVRVDYPDLVMRQRRATGDEGQCVIGFAWDGTAVRSEIGRDSVDQDGLATRGDGQPD